MLLILKHVDLKLDLIAKAFHILLATSSTVDLQTVNL